MYDALNVSTHRPDNKSVMQGMERRQLPSHWRQTATRPVHRISKTEQTLEISRLQEQIAGLDVPVRHDDHDVVVSDNFL